MSGSNYVSTSLAAVSGVISFRFKLDRVTNVASNPWLAYTDWVSLRILASGKLRVDTGTFNDSTDPVPDLADGTSWVRADITTGTGALSHFYSADGASWTANGTATITAPTVAISQFVVPDPATRATGDLLLVSVVDDGVETHRFNPTLSGPTGYTDAYGNEWTVTGGGIV